MNFIIVLLLSFTAFAQTRTQTIDADQIKIRGNTITASELGNVSGSTSNIQTQLNGKQSTLINSAGLAGALSDETGTGKAVFGTSPTLVTPAISSPTGLVKADVGLNLVDNTSDATKNSAAVSLTNKTIDADLNTITNIENADIKSGAAIDAAKLNTGVVSNTEFNYLDGVTSAIQTQINSKSNDSATVHTTGNESIAGTKTFTGKLVASSTSNGSTPCPAMTGAQITSLTGMGDGDCVYNTTTKALNYYNGTTSAWTAIGSGGGGGSRLNLLSDASFETGVTEGSCTGCTATQESTIILATPNNTKALKLAFTASTGDYTITKTTGSEYANVWGMHVIWIKNNNAGVTFSTLVDGSVKSVIPVSITNRYEPYVIFETMGSTSVGYKIAATIAITGNIYADEAELGPTKVGPAYSVADSNRISEVIFTSNTNAPKGFISALTSSIGQAGSGATFTGDAYRDLYDVLWAQSGTSTTAGDVYRISTAKGANSASDWLASKTITIDYATNGAFIRAKAAARGLGAYEVSDNKAHSHRIGYGNSNASAFGVSGSAVSGYSFANLVTAALNNSETIGGTEAKPNAVSLNPYIRYAVDESSQIVGGAGYALRAGQIITGSFSTCPTGTTDADGADVSRTDPTYSKLFAAIGTTWGQGDGSTTFSKPDLRWAFLRGQGPAISATGSGTVATNNATFTAHGFNKTGVRVRLSSGTLSGITTATDYYAIVVDANTLAFATTYANALAGTKIAISGSNSGVVSQYEDPDISTRLQAGISGATSGVGTRQADQNLSHTHQVSTNTAGASQNGLQQYPANSGVGGAWNTFASGGNQSNPRNVAVKYCVQLYDTNIVGSFVDSVKSLGSGSGVDIQQVFFGSGTNCTSACTTGTCSICNQTGSKITSVTWVSSGRYRINGLDGNKYSCNGTGYSSGYLAGINDKSAVSSSYVVTEFGVSATATTANVAYVNVTCIGTP